LEVANNSIKVNYKPTKGGDSDEEIAAEMTRAKDGMNEVAEKNEGRPEKGKKAVKKGKAVPTEEGSDFGMSDEESVIAPKKTAAKKEAPKKPPAKGKGKGKGKAVDSSEEEDSEEEDDDEDDSDAPVKKGKKKPAAKSKTVAKKAPAKKTPAKGKGKGKQSTLDTSFSTQMSSARPSRATATKKKAQVRFAP